MESGGSSLFHITASHRGNSMLRINFQYALFIFGLSWLQLFPAFFQDLLHLFGRKLLTFYTDDFQNPCRDIDMDEIAFFHKGDRASLGGFRRNMADSGTLGGSGKAAVCYQGNGFSQLRIGRNGLRGVEHFRHSGAFRTFITDEYGVTRMNAA